MSFHFQGLLLLGLLLGFALPGGLGGSPSKRAHFRGRSEEIISKVALYEVPRKQDQIHLSSSRHPPSLSLPGNSNAQEFLGFVSVNRELYQIDMVALKFWELIKTHTFLFVKRSQHVVKATLLTTAKVFLPRDLSNALEAASAALTT